MPRKANSARSFLFRKENRYLWYILILPVYLTCFFLAERIVKPEDCWVSYIPLDDRIPFLEIFAIPYVLWYPLLFSVGFYLLFLDHEGFKRYMTYIGIGFISVTVFYLISPNLQSLRPEVFPRDNLLTRLMGLLYTADTNTNVCPSIHVMGSAAAVAAAFDNRKIRSKTWLLVCIILLSVLISISTVFVKQHSILDIFVALPYALLVWFLVYPLPRLVKKKAKG